MTREISSEYRARAATPYLESWTLSARESSYGPDLYPAWRKEQYRAHSIISTPLTMHLPTHQKAGLKEGERLLR